MPPTLSNAADASAGTPQPRAAPAPAGGATWNASEVAASVVSIASSLPFAFGGYVLVRCATEVALSCPFLPASGHIACGYCEVESSQNGQHLVWSLKSASPTTSFTADLAMTTLPFLRPSWYSVSVSLQRRA